MALGETRQVRQKYMYIHSKVTFAKCVATNEEVLVLFFPTCYTYKLGSKATFIPFNLLLLDIISSSFDMFFHMFLLLSVIKSRIKHDKHDGTKRTHQTAAAFKHDFETASFYFYF